MDNRNPRDLNDENFARWERFYKKGRIDRRTLVKAAMVWAGGRRDGQRAGCLRWR